MVEPEDYTGYEVYENNYDFDNEPIEQLALNP